VARPTGFCGLKSAVDVQDDPRILPHTINSLAYIELENFIINIGGNFQRSNSYRNSQQDATVYENLLFHYYINLNMFRATHHPSQGDQNCTRSLWFCIRERLLDVVVVGR
jgi:hypothetical protein